VPSQDVVLGLYYMTRHKVNARGEGMVFADGVKYLAPTTVAKCELQARIKVRINEVLVDEVTGESALKPRLLRPPLVAPCCGKLFPAGSAL